VSVVMSVAVSGECVCEFVCACLSGGGGGASPLHAHPCAVTNPKIFSNDANFQQVSFQPEAAFLSQTLL
jgi:hypothetical protein